MSSFGVDAGVDDNSVKAAVNSTKPYEPTAKDAAFFFSILKNCKTKPDVSTNLPSPTNPTPLRSEACLWFPSLYSSDFLS